MIMKIAVAAALALAVPAWGMGRSPGEESIRSSDSRPEESQPRSGITTPNDGAAPEKAGTPPVRNAPGVTGAPGTTGAGAGGTSEDTRPGPAD